MAILVNGRRTGRLERAARGAVSSRRRPAGRFGRGGRPWNDNSVAVECLRGGARGIVAAMAMSGMRRLTTGLGWVKEEPPEAVLKDQAGRLLARVPEGRRQAAIELAHWSYGAAGGATFGLLPPAVRAHDAVGPLYGILSWLLFELGIAPLLGLPHAERSGLSEHAAIAADHVLYGTVVGASSFTQRD